MSSVRSPAASDGPERLRSFLADAAIQQILIERIEKHKCNVGIVVGLVDRGGSRVISFGKRGGHDHRPPDGDTIFDVSCLVKLFTVLLLCDMVRRGEVELSDPVSTYLPAGLRIPTRNGTPITLLELATHTSGLPAAMGATPLDRTLCAAYPSVELMYRSLSTYNVSPSDGVTYTYSTLGMQLLAHALSLRAGVDYETLLQSRICVPLALRSTGITPSNDMMRRMATGHNERLLPVSTSDVVLPGGSQLLSNAHDMIVFVEAFLNDGCSSLSPATTDMLSLRRPTYSSDTSVALGWHILERHGSEIAWHHGLGRGYRTFVAFRLDSRVGVIVLSNASTNAGVHDIGYHLLDSSYPLHPPDSRLLLMPDQYVAATIDHAIYDRYAGLYQLTPTRLMSVTRDGDRLLAQWTGQRPHEIVPRNERTFFYDTDGPDITPYTTITFESDAGGGKAAGLIVHNLTRDLRLVRIDVEPQPVWFGRRQIDVGPVMPDYAGRYQLGDAAVTITLEGHHVFLEEPYGPRIELLPCAQHCYFYKSDTVDAQITFELDLHGRAKSIVLRSQDLSERGRRSE